MRKLDIPQSLVGLKRGAGRARRLEGELDRPPRELLRPEFLAQLRRLDLRAKVLLQGFLQGLHRAPRRGFSAEFSEYRNFVAGDDARWIDWRIYARTDRLFVKRFEAESALRATLIVDGSASMGYCSPEPVTLASGRGGTPRTEVPVFTKLGYAVTLAAALAYLLQHQRDRVGLFLAGGASPSNARPAPVRGWLERLRRPAGNGEEPGGGGRYLPPRSSRHHALRVLRELSAFQAGGAADIVAALEQFARQERRRGLVLLFSDGLCPRERLLGALRRLRHRGHEVIFFQIWDPAEIAPPLAPGFALRDPESGALFDPLPRDEYARRIRTHLAGLKRGCLTLGCTRQFLLTTTPFDRALLQFLHLRRQRN